MALNWKKNGRNSDKHVIAELNPLTTGYREMGIVLWTWLWILNLRYSAWKWLFVFILVFFEIFQPNRNENEISFSASKVSDYVLESCTERNVERNNVIHQS